MKTVNFVIAGIPVAKGRPRFRVFRGFVQSYTPAKTKLAEKAIKEEFQKSYPDFDKPFNGPIRLTVRFFMPVPESISKKKKSLLYGKSHTKKPDLDNLVKTVCDALNGVVWNDDSQIVELYETKQYALESDEPSTCVWIEEIDL